MLPAPTCPQVVTPTVTCSVVSQAEVLLGEFWDSSSGAVFAEEGDQERFWKLTRRFAENLVAMAEDGTRVRAVSCLQAEAKAHSMMRTCRPGHAAVSMQITPIKDVQTVNWSCSYTQTWVWPRC